MQRIHRTRNERRLRRRQGLSAAVFSACILCALFADSWVEVLLG